LNKAAKDLLPYTAQKLELSGESMTSNECNQSYMHSE